MFFLNYEITKNEEYVGDFPIVQFLKLKFEKSGVENILRRNKLYSAGPVSKVQIHSKLEN